MTHSAPGFGNEDLRALGQRLRQLREQRQWSLKRLATESDVSVAAIRKIELGQSNPSLLTVLSLIEALGEPIDRLISAARDSDVRITLTRAPARGGAAGEEGDRTRDLTDAAMRCSVVTLPTGEPLEAMSETDPAFGYVLDGSVRIEDAAGDTVTCSAGDAFHVPSLDRFQLSGARGRAPRLVLVRDISSGDAEPDSVAPRHG